MYFECQTRQIICGQRMVSGRLQMAADSCYSSDLELGSIFVSLNLVLPSAGFGHRIQ